MMEHRTVKAVQDGALIHYSVDGPEGTPVTVLLHGNGEDMHIYDSHVQYLSQYTMTVAVDTRGHGRSERGDAPFGFYTFAIDTLAVLDDLKVRRAVLVGFSDGGNTALHVAKLAPERVWGMFLIGANYHYSGLKPFLRLRNRVVYTWLKLAQHFSEKALRSRELLMLMVSQPNLTVAELKEMKMPVMIVTGEHDIVSEVHTDEMIRAVSGSDGYTVYGEDHFWMLKQPDLFHRLVMDFVEKVRRT